MVWSTNNSFSGGLLGAQVIGWPLNEDDSIMKNCYTAGKVLQPKGHEVIAGGLVGKKEGNVNNCYFDEAITGQHFAFGSAWYIKGDNGNVHVEEKDVGADGKDTNEMKTKETFIGWDFDNIWIMPDEGGYPQLRWIIGR